MIGLLLVGGFFALIVVSTLLRGWVLTWIWAWFVVPLGAPEIGVAWAIGISGLVAMFTSHLKSDDDESDLTKRLSKAFGGVLVVPLLTLLVGWIAHSFM